MAEFSYVQAKHGLCRDKMRMDIIQSIHKRISDEYPDFRTLKNDLELLSLICNIIENAISKKSKLNKADVLVEIFIKLYGNYTAEEKTVLLKNVDYLLDNGKIKKTPIYKKAFRLFVNFLLSRL